MREKTSFARQAVAIEKVSTESKYATTLGHKNVYSLAKRFTGVMAEPAVGPSTMSSGEKVLAYDIALLLTRGCTGSEGWAHGLADDVAGLLLGGRGKLLHV